VAFVFFSQKEMPVAGSHQHRHLARNLIIGFLVLVVLYALAGFLLLPWWLERALPDQLEQRMGWQASVENIHVNPFTLSVDATGLHAKDSEGQPVVGFDRLLVNLNFFQLIRGTVGFQTIELQEPFIRLDLLKDDRINLARDWQSHNPPGDQPASEDTSTGESEPPRLYFQHLAIQGGELLFRDFSQQAPAEFQVQPLDLAVNDLATWPRDDNSHYHLQAAVGSQTIDWEGVFSVKPLYSKGHLNVSGIDYTTLKHFLASVMPYDLRGGQVSVESDYELKSGQHLYLTTSDGSLSLADLAIAIDKKSDEARLTTGTLGINHIGFDLTARRAQVGQITVSHLNLALARNASGVVDWLAPLDSNDQKQSPATGNAPDSAAFNWSVDGIAIADSQVHWQDNQPATEADLSLTQLSLTTGKLSGQLEEPITYKVAATLASGGKLSLQGQITPEPFNLEAALSGADIALVAFTPYLQEGANLAVTAGSLGVDGHLDLDSQKDPLTGTFSGTASIDGLSLSLPGEQTPLISWQTLRLAPIEYNVHPARLEIGTVALTKPDVHVVREADSSHNLEHIIRPDETARANDAAPSTSTESSQSGFIFRIGQVTLESGAVDYTDRTMRPAFTTSLDQLNGSISGLSNIAPQQAKVAINGRVNQAAKVKFQGEIGTLGTEDESNLKLTMSDLSLPALSPYFGRYLGYGVDGGKLDLNLDYKIAGGHIDATNQVTMDRLQLGNAVASDQAVNAPVKLGLALLRDQNGVIEVDLPISGDLSDPGFGVGNMVMRTFVNLLAKAATSPFSMLGSIASLAGFSGEELGQVSFPAGSAELDTSELEKLQALATALRDRPDLLLNIRGGFAPEADGLALLRKKLTNNGENTLSDEDWQNARKAYMAGKPSLPPEALGRLANARADTVRSLLQNTYNAPADQLFLREPSRDAKVGSNHQVINGFTLDVR
jgi:uncharacterized protein involved in outer membrane biogenesis